MTTDPPRLKPILKAPPPSSFIGARTSPRKKSDCSQLSDTTTLVDSNRGSTVEQPTDKKPLQSLQTIKQKFLPKEQPRAWDQYSIPSTTVHTLPNTDFEDMIQQLDVSYAQTAALRFKTMSFVDADKLIGKSEQLKKVIESMYERIRIYIDTTRATIMSLKLDAPQNQHLCQLGDYAVQMEQLIGEFHFTSKYANHVQTSYLEHLAGTLCHHPMGNNNLNFLTKILARLKSILLEEDHSFTWRQSENPLDIHQHIDAIIDKLARQFKIVFDARLDPAHDELIKQRERSASLVLELEQNRSQRISQTQKKETELVSLKEQLVQETTSRQALQNRVIELEKALKTKEALLRNRPQETDLIQKLHELKEEKTDWCNTKKSILSRCYTVIGTRQEDLELVVQHLVEKIKNTESLQQSQENQNNGHLVENVSESDALISKQQELDQLKEDFKQILKLYNTRESGYILQSASTEAELERILKEYDRLTRNIIDFNHERKRFEQEIRELHSENLQLSKELMDEKVQHMPGSDGNLRKEFRDLMAVVKTSHAQELLEALDTRRKIEHASRQKMSEIEMKRWEKVDIAVQTSIQFPF
ncbi:uncharacterized protein EV154DRAFT_587835 [Mucor mucedo]|uniref:uncharacterized protein n=1 Tax=Mucor mucedo TaxID=29922 RepID=UPI002220EB66|nr:uncharacterized protein EV154DRAFT_587835 [Mucor mucedo]KAI7891771.1 hypothetical protein EV154DRAFT_587835 [Mucor mucedo]